MRLELFAQNCTLLFRPVARHNGTYCDAQLSSHFQTILTRINRKNVSAVANTHNQQRLNSKRIELCQRGSFSVEPRSNQWIDMVFSKLIGRVANHIAFLIQSNAAYPILRWGL